MEEKNWIISLSNKKEFNINEEGKLYIENGISKGLKWLLFADLLINVNHIVAIYKLEEKK